MDNFSYIDSDYKLPRLLQTVSPVFFKYSPFSPTDSIAKRRSSFSHQHRLARRQMTSQSTTPSLRAAADFLCARRMPAVPRWFHVFLPYTPCLSSWTRPFSRTLEPSDRPPPSSSSSSLLTPHGNIIALPAFTKFMRRCFKLACAA